jgi:hypothetical protein
MSKETQDLDMRLLNATVINDIGVRIGGYGVELRRFRITVMSMIRQTFEAELTSKTYFRHIKKKFQAMYKFFQGLSHARKAKAEGWQNIFAQNSGIYENSDGQVPVGAGGDGGNLSPGKRGKNTEIGNKGHGRASFKDNKDERYYELFAPEDSHGYKWKHQTHEFERYKEDRLLVDEKDILKLKNAYSSLYNHKSNIDPDL